MRWKNMHPNARKTNNTHCVMLRLSSRDSHQYPFTMIERNIEGSLHVVNPRRTVQDDAQQTANESCGSRAEQRQKSVNHNENEMSEGSLDEQRMNDEVVAPTCLRAKDLNCSRPARAATSALQTIFFEFQIAALLEKKLPERLF
jgi:hypothetical protein